jgi:hypothetical protein
MNYSEFLKLSKFNYTAFARSGIYASKSSYQHHRQKLFSELFYTHSAIILSNATKLQRLVLYNDASEIDTFEDFYIKVKLELAKDIKKDKSKYKPFVIRLHTIYLLYIAEVPAKYLTS